MVCYLQTLRLTCMCQAMQSGCWDASSFYSMKVFPLAYQWWQYHISALNVLHILHDLRTGRLISHRLPEDHYTLAYAANCGINGWVIIPSCKGVSCRLQDSTIILEHFLECQSQDSGVQPFALLQNQNALHLIKLSRPHPSINPLDYQGRLAQLVRAWC